jgi:hypothetical protein
MNRWSVYVVILAAIGVLLIQREWKQHSMPTDFYRLDCVIEDKSLRTECPDLAVRQLVSKPTGSDASELILDQVFASLRGGQLTVEALLRGRFWNEFDQNLYIFIGAGMDEGSPAVYSLSADSQYFTDLGYPVRGEIGFFHKNDIRIGIMAPDVSTYSPQVYINNPVRTDAVGESSGIIQLVDGSRIRIVIPLARYYARRGAAIPAVLSVTVATARDYVGFIDMSTITGLSEGISMEGVPSTLPANIYPSLDPDSHVFERVAVSRSNKHVYVEMRMAGAIRDWGQTNLHVFFVPVPADQAASPLPDPSQTMWLPYKWSFYCGVYSPQRIFCKASGGDDFRFDTGYAQRETLDAFPGVVFRSSGERDYVLELSEEMESVLRGRGSKFALVVSAGRDGFGPTSWYGSGGLRPPTRFSKP